MVGMKIKRVVMVEGKQIHMTFGLTKMLQLIMHFRENN